MAQVVQTSFAGGEITPELEGRVDLGKYKIGASELTNMVVRKFGSITRRPGTTAIFAEDGTELYSFDTVSNDPDDITQEDIDEAARVRLIPFRFSSGDSFVLVFHGNGGTRMSVIKPQASGSVVIQTGVPERYNLSIPWALDDYRELKYTQDADNLYVTHPAYAPYVITRIADNNWTVTALDFTAPTPPVGMTGAFYKASIAATAPAATAKVHKYAVTSIDVYGNESEISNVIEVTIDSAWPISAEARLGWTKTAGAVRYNVYKNSRNYWGYVGTVADDDVVNPIDLLGDFAFRDDRIEENVAEGPPEWPASQFDATGEYPGALAIFEQRMMYARTDDQPNTVFGSQTGDFENLSTSYPLKETDAIEATISSGEIDVINHLVPIRDIVILTEGSEWVMSHGDNVDALSPTSIQFRITGRNGSRSSVRPIVIGNRIIFADRTATKILDLGYSFDADSFESTDLTILAPHLFDGYTIIDTAYQQTPDSILWVVRNDGVLLSLTYDKAQDVWAWAKHDFGGATGVAVEQGWSAGDPMAFATRVCVVPSQDGVDRLFIMVYRNYYATSYFGAVEELSDKSDGTTTAKTTLDNRANYDGAATTTPFASKVGKFYARRPGRTGASTYGDLYLRVISDGEILTRVDSSPSAGEYSLDYTLSPYITLGVAAAAVSVGINYDSVFQSLPLVHADQRGAPSYGDKNTIAEVTLRVHKSRGAQVGTDETDLVDIPWQDDGETGIAPKSRDFTVPLRDHRTTQTRVYIKQSEPSPFTLLSFSAEVEVGR